MGYPRVLFADSRQWLWVAGKGEPGVVQVDTLRCQQTSKEDNVLKPMFIQIIQPFFWCYLISWNRKKCWNWNMLYSSVLGYKLTETSNEGSVVLLSVVNIDGVAPCE